MVTRCDYLDPDDIRGDIGDCHAASWRRWGGGRWSSAWQLERRLMFIGEAPGADEDVQGVHSSVAPRHC